MKIEIGESLGYSYLRHVKGCWLVQTNWKASDNWTPLLDSEELERAFQEIREDFDQDGSVLKGTRNFEQFLKQAEIDVVGIDQSGAIHAMDIAFHEAGLNYLGGADKRVLKKLLRAKLALDAYHREEIERHIYFVSPKVNPGVLEPLEEVFEQLQGYYPDVHWHLMVNAEFANEVLEPTLEKAGRVSDTAELFVRSAKLLNLADSVSQISYRKSTTRTGSGSYVGETGRERTSDGSYTLQDIVQRLMHTLLDEHQSLLREADRQNLADASYCKNYLGLKISNLSLLRRKEEGRAINGHDRYYNRAFGDTYFVISQWWRQNHRHNAIGLLRFVDELIGKNPGNAGLPALESHRTELLNYLDANSG